MKFKFLLLAFCLKLSSIYAQTPELIKDIVPGQMSSTFLVADIAFTLDSFYFFSADNDINGPELWVTTGTTASTHLLKDIFPYDATPFNQDYLINFNHAAYFVSDDDTLGGFSIWKTDGTTEGTTLFFDDCDLQSANPSAYGVLGDKMIFSGLYNGNHELYVSDGTTAGTTLLKQINTGSGGSKPAGFRNFKGKLFFTAGDIPQNRELWQTDGTPEGTVLVLDINGNPTASSEPQVMGIIGDYMYFSATVAGTTGRELWRTDGTEQGTTLVKDINPGTGSGLETNIAAVMGDKLVFVADDGEHGKELWVTDGTSDGTILVKDIREGNVSTTFNGMVLSKDSFVLFFANDGVHGRELWRTDGTEQGTFLLKDIREGSGNGISAVNLDLKYTVYNGILYFTGVDNTYGPEIWKTDGTEVGTVRLTDMVDNTSVSEKEYLKVINGYLYFSAATTQYGYEPWRLLVDNTTESVSPENSVSDLRVYPNPNTSGDIRISGYSNGAVDMQAILRNAQGQVLSSDFYNLSKGSFVHQINVPALPGGMYYLSLHTNTGVRTIPVTILNHR